MPGQRARPVRRAAAGRPTPETVHGVPPPTQLSALRAGASGFVLKDIPADDLARAIRSVASGDAVVSPRVTRLLLDIHATRLPDIREGPVAVSTTLDRLTRRETEVLQEMAQGLSNTEIAEKLSTMAAVIGNCLSAEL